MITLERYKKWALHDYDQSLNMIAVDYEPEIKEKYIKESGFGINCKISDKRIFTRILSKTISVFIGKAFMVRLENEEFSWLPEWLKEEFDDYTEIEKYLINTKWVNNELFGSFKIEEIECFLSLFIDYPLKYEYQDILLFSIESNFIITISHHGTIWIITDLYDKLKPIATKLEKEGATVFPRKYLT